MLNCAVAGQADPTYWLGVLSFGHDLNVLRANNAARLHTNALNVMPRLLNIPKMPMREHISDG